LLGFAALSPAFARALGAEEAFTLGAEALVPVLWIGLAFAGVWWIWRRRPAEDPARALGGGLRPLFGNAFYLDAVQNALVVRPVTALARAVRRADESGVDGVVEATGRGTVGLGGLAARLHRAAVPRAVAAGLLGAALLGLAAVAIVEVWP
jgi:NADH-quinone oxidoreductase subunit L